MEKLIQYRTHESLFDGAFNREAGWHAAGMGYLIVTERGKLIAVDGGCKNDAEDFLALLEKQADGRKPVVDVWIVTHSHGDHTGVLYEIANNPVLSERVLIKEILYYFPEEFIDKNLSHPNVTANRKMADVLEATGAEPHHPALDEKLFVDGVELHFLYYAYDCHIINGIGNTNQCSLIFTAQGKNKKVMFTGDAGPRNLQIVTWLYRKHLSCDILQMPHHALADTGLLDFYKEVDADVLLEPTCIAGDRAMHSELYCHTERAMCNAWAEDRASTVYKSFNGTVEIAL